MHPLRSSAAQAGIWNIVVTNPDGQSVVYSNAFTIKNPAPALTSITPSTAMNTGSVSISNLAGTGFMNSSTVTLTKTGQPNITATGVSAPSSSQILCTFPLLGALAGVWNIVVTNPDGQSVTKLNAFTIKNPAPTLTSITPSSGMNTGAVSISNLAGSGFINGTHRTP